LPRAKEDQIKPTPAMAKTTATIPLVGATNTQAPVAMMI
jgi:hypothetical protein